MTVVIILPVYTRRRVRSHLRMSTHVRNPYYERKIALANITSIRANIASIRAIAHAKYELCCRSCNTSDYHLLLSLVQTRRPVRIDALAPISSGRGQFCASMMTMIIDFHFHIVYEGWPFSIVLVSKGPSIYFTISLVLKN